MPTSDIGEVERARDPDIRNLSSVMDSPKSNPRIDFDRAFEDHSRVVFRAVRSIIEDSGLAEDIVQETYLRLFKSIDLITEARAIAAVVDSSRHKCRPASAQRLAKRRH